MPKKPVTLASDAPLETDSPELIAAATAAVEGDEADELTATVDALVGPDAGTKTAPAAAPVPKIAQSRVYLSPQTLAEMKRGRDALSRKMAVPVTIEE